MKSWRVVGLAAVLAVSAGTVFRSHSNSEAKKKREAAYEVAVHTYSQAFTPGLDRKDVEAHLRANGTVFTQICCIKERSALADLVKIGEEKPPWYCNAHWVHVALEFAATISRFP